MATFEITIPDWHHARLNTLLGHWGKRHKMKKVDRDTVSLFCLQASKATRRRRVSLIIGLGPRQRGADPDAYWKSLLDALVRTGMIVDDSGKWVELGPVQFVRKGDPGWIDPATLGPLKAAKYTTIILDDL